MLLQERSNNHVCVLILFNSPRSKEAQMFSTCRWPSSQCLSLSRQQTLYSSRKGCWFLQHLKFICISSIWLPLILTTHKGTYLDIVVYSTLSPGLSWILFFLLDFLPLPCPFMDKVSPRFSKLCQYFAWFLDWGGGGVVQPKERPKSSHLTKLQSRWKAVGKWPALYCSAGRQSTRKKRTHSMPSGLCVDSAFSTNSPADTGRQRACEMLDVSADSSSPYNTFNRSCTENYQS